MISSILARLWGAFKLLSALAVIYAFSQVLLLFFALSISPTDGDSTETEKVMPPRLVENYMAPIALSSTLNITESTAAAGLSQEERTERLLAASVKISLPTHTGSGVLVDNQNCLVITNAHVADANGTITVLYSHGYRPDGSRITRQAEGKMVAFADVDNDLALIQFEGCENLPYTPIYQGVIKTGSIAIAVGNPRGQNWTYTQGIVSHPDRHLHSLTARTGFSMIQTDAAINSGNSGGALFNAKGYLIGINSNTIRASDNLALARSAQVVQAYLDMVSVYGYMPRIYHGILEAFPLDHMAAQEYDVPQTYLDIGAYGVFVQSVEPDSLADTTGLKTGDIILAFNEQAIYNFTSLNQHLFAAGYSGQHVLTVFRDGEIIYLNLDVAEPTVGSPDWYQDIVDAQPNEEDDDSDNS